MASNFTVLYDSCVLYPAPLRDLLMQLALTDLFRAKWTDRIHDEWIRNVLKKNSTLTLEQLTRTKNLMNSHVRDCLITDYEHLIPAVQLPDPDDRHVLAAAIKGGANVIVTLNIKDFPEQELNKYHINALHPDDFISDLLDLSFPRIKDAIEKCQRRLRNPPKNMDEYLQILVRQQLPVSVSTFEELYE